MTKTLKNVIVYSKKYLGASKQILIYQKANKELLSESVRNT